MMKRRPDTNICMVVYTLYTMDSRVRREAETLSSQPNNNVRVLTLKQGDRARTYELEGVTVEELNAGKYRGDGTAKYFFSYTIFLARAFFVVCRLFLRGKTNVVHIHNMPNFIVFAALLPKLFGKKVILDVHDTMVETFAAKFQHNPRSFLHRMLLIEEAVSCRFADRIICVNDVQKQIIVARGIPEAKITTILNVPDDKFFHYDKLAPAREGQDTFKLVYHGTVTQRLGIDLAINTIERLRDQIPGIYFTIIGGGDDWDKCRNLTRELKAEDLVSFNNGVPIEELSDILEKMDLGVIPNRRNIASDLMLPVKMLEYVALGIPTIAPRLKTIQHYFSDDMVFYFEPDDVDSLAETILLAYGDRGKRIEKARNAKAFLDKYGWYKHKERLLSLYEDL